MNAISPRDWKEALLYAQDQSSHPTQSWQGLCQMFVHDAYGIPALFSSAWTQWLGCDPAHKHVGGNSVDAPVGAALCYKGAGVFGHIMLAAHPLPDNSPAAWSNDLVRNGYIDKVKRTDPETKWAQNYLGYLTAVNDYDLQLKTAKPAKPLQSKRYVGIDHAIQHLQAALDTAHQQHDQHDIDLLSKEVADLKGLYDSLRHA